MQIAVYDFHYKPVVAYNRHKKSTFCLIIGKLTQTTQVSSILKYSGEICKNAKYHTFTDGVQFSWRATLG